MFASLLCFLPAAAESSVSIQGPGVTPKGSMMLDLLSFRIFVFQANLLRRCEDGGGRLSASGTLIADYEQGLVHSTRSEQMDEIL